MQLRCGSPDGDGDGDTAGDGMSDIDSTLREFLVESHENLDRLDGDLVSLEERPDDQEMLDRIFRTIHTIKGTCGFLGLETLESVSHEGENLLSKLRDGELVANAEITTALLELVDAIREILSEIEETQQEGDRDYAVVISRLRVLSGSAGGAESKSRLGDLLVKNGATEPVDVSEALATQQSGDSRPVGEILVEQGAASSEDVDAALREQSSLRAGGVAESHIRVGVSLLDELMNLVGELVLCRNQILQYGTAQQDGVFLKTAQRLNLITTELQEGVMQTRMQPIGTIWDKFPRVVRDLCVACGKRVRVEMEGRETELDRTLVESIKDPLTHIVRNAVDHGIESPEERSAAGKDPEGRLFLRAFHEGGQVNIEISDDGKGIDCERIRMKAIERGLLRPDQAENMGERELAHLLFHPGFSTAEKVTNVSGRGVGMDVVKSNIEKIGGVVDLQSEVGRGTLVKIKIPLTLAIIPALLVNSGEERYAIPQVSLLELVRVERGGSGNGIEHAHGAPVYRLRGNLLPLVFLSEALGAGAPTAEMSDVTNIVVLQAGEQQFGLVVDDVRDTQEIVVKPLGKQFKHIRCFAGATILGDGRVALILDALGLAEACDLFKARRDEATNEMKSSSASAETQLQSLLLFSVGNDTRMAVPLELVTRLEEFPRNGLEQASGRLAVQYRGHILPLLDLTRLLGRESAAGSSDGDSGEPIQVIVYSEGDRQVGFIVGQILDVIESSYSIDQSSDRQGVRGSAIIETGVTDLIDPREVIETFDPGLLSAESVDGQGA